jgi:hypothetical protein
LGALAALTTWGPYPLSMVGLPGERVSNMAPPTACLVALTVFQVCLVMLVRPIAQGWLADRRIWTAVIAGNGVIMTIFLWHLTALLVALSALHAFGFPQPDGGAALWWMTRPIVLLLAALPLAGFVRCFGNVERPEAAEYRARNVAPVAGVGIGVTLLSIAIFGVASSNVPDLLDGTRVQLAVVGVTSLQILACALGGWFLITAAVRRTSLAQMR